MHNTWRLIRGILLVTYLLVVVYLFSINSQLSFFYNFPIWIIPVITLLSIILIGDYYTNLSLNNEKLEFEFTSIVNHAFRTPLTRINWLIKELEKDLPTPERLSYLQGAQNATTRVIEIVDIIAGIQNMNDKSGYFFEATSFRDIIEKSISKYRDKINEKNITFKVSTFKDMPLLTIDTKKISFVIDVLMENAIFYTPQNGKILVDSIIRSKKIIFYITDTGLGLSFADKMRIFSKFYRSKKAKLMNTDGLGLGLYLSKIIINRHHGKIYAKSKGRDKGSAFFIELPFSK